MLKLGFLFVILALLAQFGLLEACAKLYEWCEGISCCNGMRCRFPNMICMK
nr:venom polypeptide precursor [Doratifera vulnerans]